MKTNKTYIIVLLILAFAGITEAQQLSVSGFITDSRSGELLIGANILIFPDSNISSRNLIYGTATNNYGYYIISGLERREYVFVFRYIGYKPLLKKIDLRDNNFPLNLNIELLPQNIEINEVLVEGKKIDKTLPGTIDVPPDLISSLPTLTGEIDLFRTLEFLPGVSKSAEISSGLYIRGSSPDQTLTLVDDIVVYNPAHIGNIASTFNSSAIRDIKLIKGAFPAQYGGRLSSVLDVKLRSGTREKETGSMGIGTVNSFATMEGPLQRNSTYMISGRWMYYDKIQKAFGQNTSVPRYGFYDINAKVSFNLSEKSILTLSGIFNNDNLYQPPGSDISYDIQWKNTSLSLNWLQISRKSLFLNSSFSFVNYTFNSRISPADTSVRSTSYFSNPDLTDVIFKQQAEMDISNNNKLKMGIELAFHNYDLLYNDFYDPAYEKDPFAGNNINSIEGSLFVQGELEPFNGFKTNIGGRFIYFGNRESFRFEPRASVSYELFKDLYIKTAAALVHQYLHLVLKNDITLPTDFWYPSTKNIKPSRSSQFVFGVDGYLDDNMYQLSAETYYKRMSSLYELRNSAVLNPLQDNIEDQFVEGEGEAYGLELFFSKRKGSISGWIGYTLSWTKRQFDRLNSGKVFYPKYDRRHEVSLVLTYRVNEKLDFGITWMYATGQRYSLPPGQFGFENVGFPGQQQNMLYFEEPNQYKYPSYHKMDATINYKFEMLDADAQVYLSVYNVYNRQNVFAQFIVFEKDELNNLVGKIKRITLFPIIPSAGIIIRL